MIRKIISGGQTGVDRAALDWAMKYGIQHGGWCPAGRRAEDGAIPERYSLQETPARQYQQRTRWNVRDSDATLIISLSTKLTGGSLATEEWANKMNRPCLHVYPRSEWRSWLRTFIETHPIRVLNVAGPRLSGAANIEQFVGEVLDEISIYCNRRNRL
jgi:hypothetical protein